MSLTLQSDSWEIGILGEISNFIDYRGKTPQKTTSGIPLITAKNIRNGFIKADPREYISEADYDSWMTRGIPNYGDIVITTEAPLGNVALLHTREKIALAQRAICIQSFNSHMNTYIHYALRSPAFQKELTSNATGTTVSGIKASTLKKLGLPIPSLSEQKIIAEKLDTLLAQVDSTKARLEQIPQILKRFRQAVLASVVCGKLSKNTGQWKTYLLKNICTSISDGDHQAPPKSETGIPFLVISDVNKGNIDFENVSRWVPESYYESLKEIRKPFQNDILYTVTGSYGIPVIVNTTKPFCFQRHIAIIKPNSSLIDYKFLAFYLESPQIFKHASDVATGTAQKTVSLSSLRNFELSVPSLEEQHEIVRQVEQLFAWADTIEKQVNSALTRVNSLTQSILAKAFRGELTAQWRAENPDLISGENSAAALLEKIKAERAASGGKKASRKKA
ncbi:restriction endonuclease subunit S [Salmonella enterica]|nr:restriction endonuclease subunit S [Salmonella enterica]EDK0184578.1 restriction endonuclease subunit S [Salmonella enterica]